MNAKEIPLSNHLLLKTPSSIDLIEPEEILYCLVHNRDVTIKLTSQRSSRILHSLKDLETILPSESFYRCHKKAIIHLRYISKYNHKSGQVEMADGNILQVAKDRKSNFYKLLKSIVRNK